MSNDLAVLLEKAESRRRFNRLLHFEPTEKQRQFHKIGATKRERALIAGNRTGKSEGGFVLHIRSYSSEIVGSISGQAGRSFLQVRCEIVGHVPQ